MKENVLDVLMYLFDNYLENDISFYQSQDHLQRELQVAGFHPMDINKALSWLEALKDLSKPAPKTIDQHQNTSFRVFNELECHKLSTASRGFLVFLEQAGVIDSDIREITIDRCMALELPEIDLDHFKWIILIVLFNRKNKDNLAQWLEELAFDEIEGQRH